MREADDGFQAKRLKALDDYLAASHLKLGQEAEGTVAAWFLGPKAENEKLLRDLVLKAIKSHCDYRRAFHPEDPVYISWKLKWTSPYRQAAKNLRFYAQELYAELKRSAPIFSMRHQGHMLWDQALPAMVGYFGAMLYNQNNVAAEASPVTTGLEIEVGQDLCRMLGFDVPPRGASDAPGKVVPWGHITCDGSVANIEALWVARNAKFFGIALQAALRSAPQLARAKNLTVKLLDGREAKLLDLDGWALLNLKIDTVVGLPRRIQDVYGVSVAATNEALSDYTVQNIGLLDFYRRFMGGIAPPIALVPSTRHYSWPKGGTLLGLGQNAIVKVEVDLQARMRLDELTKRLDVCLRDHVPVIAVVAVIGSTEESAVDPLRDILDLRERFREQGLDFLVHCDAAWGGYFNTMLRRSSTMLRKGSSRGATDADEFDVPTLSMSPYVVKQYRALKDADSITVDPHKAGYAPYPAGGLCYRNSAMRDLISLKAPVVFHSQAEPTVGIYGIEGSKPGAAAAGVYLAHRVIPPTKAGYGAILGQCMWTSTRLYCRLVTMRARDPDKPRYELVLFQMLPAERARKIAGDIQKEKTYIADNFVDCTNEELQGLLRRDAYARDLFMNLGSDQVILAYSFNYYDEAGRINRDVARLNQLNDKIFEICSILVPVPDLNTKRLIVTSSAFDVPSYGRAFIDHYGGRLGVDNPAGLPISFLISTTMDPWTTDTPKGDFLAIVEEALRNAVKEALAQLKF